MDRLAQEASRLRHVTVQGVVQGVGFRPFVFRLAREYDLKGWVLNTSGGVEIEVEGKLSALDRFIRSLEREAPPLAHIKAIRITDRDIEGYSTFEIRESLPDCGYQLVSPDIATCKDCLREIFDQSDRRYRYPFTNCTNCGPRFTIINNIPYDRPNTTMAGFRMCHECQAEYDNPLNRRFHAQPNACPTCGPQLRLVAPAGNRILCEDPIRETARLLTKGHIMAVKGLGGFHLACDATNGEAVALLRSRKRRPQKPLGVMVKDLGQAERHCMVSRSEADLLSSPQAPIVLLRWKDDSDVSRLVAPGNLYLGVMLPYTPVHHLLLQEFGRPLVMTSGNLSEEPIAAANGEALERLKELADFFLLHDRDIHSRYDDSVLMKGENGTQPVRRARGYAPYPVSLPFKAVQVLATGGQEKNTFCLTRDEFAFLSQHIGDLENPEALEHFGKTIEIYKHLFRVAPAIIAHDLHPDYLSTRYALQFRQELPLIGVQHHHAHIASCMVDNGIIEPVIGVALDGSGFGPDGAVWGGEFLLADLNTCRRLGYLEYLPMPGGEMAIRKPYRLAISYLYSLTGSLPALPFLNKIADEEVQIILQQIEAHVNTPLTSSCGRLFDAVSALLDICGIITFEGEAAVTLEMAAGNSASIAAYPFDKKKVAGVWQIGLGKLFGAILSDLRSGLDAGEIALNFHNSVALMISQMASSISEETGIRKVALSGGCFQNRLLLNRTLLFLEKAGLESIIHRQVPCNDGGLALGQAAIAAYGARNTGDLSAHCGSAVDIVY